MKVKIILCEHGFEEIAEGKIVFHIVRTGTYFDAQVNDSLFFLNTESGDGVLRVVRQVEEVRPGYVAYGFSEKLESETYSHILGFEPVKDQPGLFKDDRDGAIVNIRDADALDRAKWHVEELKRKARAVLEAGGVR